MPVLHAHPASLQPRQLDRDITTPSLNKSYTNDFTLFITGGSADTDYAVDIASNVGYLTIQDRRTAVVVTEQIEMANATLYSVWGVDEHGPVAHVLYCAADNTLSALWVEDVVTEPGFASATLSGTCSLADTRTTGTASLSASSFTVGTPNPVPAIQGDSLTITPQADGSVQLPDTDTAMDLFAYAYLNCVSCQQQGTTSDYHELHVLLRNETEVCTATIFLFEDHTKDIQLAWLHCLQSDFVQQGISFEASWTAP